MTLNVIQDYQHSLSPISCLYSVVIMSLSCLVSIILQLIYKLDYVIANHLEQFFSSNKNSKKYIKHGFWWL